MRRWTWIPPTPATGAGALLVLPLMLIAAGCAPTAAAARLVPGGPVLVELFTSQGCSSCPAADALVRELPRLGYGRDRVVALTFHVDYWDGLGWKDSFASPAFTARQRLYVGSGALAAPDGERGIRGAYTPQMVVNGAVHFSGARRETALAEIQRAAAAPVVAALTASAAVDGERALVRARLSPPPPSPSPGGDRGADPSSPSSSDRSWRLIVALAMKSARTPVTHGENAGEVLEEASIVRVLSGPVPISATGAAIVVPITKPSDLDWNAVELTAFVQSETTLHVIVAQNIPIPIPISRQVH